LYRAQPGRPSSYPAWSEYPEMPTSNPNPTSPPSAILLRTPGLSGRSFFFLRYVVFKPNFKLRSDRCVGARASPQLLVPTRPKKNALVAIHEVRKSQIAGANEIPTGSFPLATRWNLVYSPGIIRLLITYQPNYVIW
jgi:hypothetical protein